MIQGLPERFSHNGFLIDIICNDATAALGQFRLWQKRLSGRSLAIGHVSFGSKLAKFINSSLEWLRKSVGKELVINPEESSQMLKPWSKVATRVPNQRAKRKQPVYTAPNRSVIPKNDRKRLRVSKSTTSSCRRGPHLKQRTLRVGKTRVLSSPWT